MLSIGSMTSGQGFYYTELAREDYYLEGGEPPGHWHGKGARALGLSGVVDKHELHAVMQGLGPDGHKLVQNAGKPNHQAGLDLTFSADKSVSVLWAMSDANTRKGIEGAQRQAVHSALDYLQSEAAWTRRGHGGGEFERCDLSFALFEHSTSRAQDPNLHTHVLVPNVGVRADGKTSALWNREFYEHKMAAGAIYRVALAHELGPKGLGYAIEADPERGLFRLGGVSQELCDHFSKRRQQIEHELMEKGYSSAKAADMANRNTREVKGHVARAELFGQWTGEAQELGFESKDMPGRTRKPKERGNAMQLAEIAKAQAAKLATERATFRKQDLVRALAGLSQDGVTNHSDVVKAADKEISSGDVLAISKTRRHAIYTTQEQLASEQGLLRFAEALSKDKGLVVDSKIAEKSKARRAELLASKERQAAFDYLTTEPGNLKVLRGVAGTGKTSLLKVAREAWESQGYNVVGMALSGKAARELQNGASIDTETVRKRQLQLEPSLRETLKHHGRELYRAARWGRAKGYKANAMDGLKLDSKTVVVIDECSMLGVEDTSQMLRLAAKAHAKVVLVGDERQLPAINAVSPFEAIKERYGHFELKEIKRQRNHEWMREMVRAFADGDSNAGLSLLTKNGALHASKGGPEATKARLLKDWQEDPFRLDEKVILTMTNNDAADFNRRAQELRKAKGKLGAIGVSLGSSEKAYRGDRVLFGKNDRRLDVRNGETATITGVHRPLVTTFKNGEVTALLDSGRKVRINLDKYDSLSLGYALTTHKAQGMTVDSAFVYTTPSEARRDLLYVQTSRAREDLSVYCPGHDLGEDLGALKDAIERETAQKLAVQRQQQKAKELEAEQDRSRMQAIDRERGMSR